ncbi:MAG: hypothetical protein ACR2J8_09945, partial [Thermomicrobiales bacterium]
MDAGTFDRLTRLLAGRLSRRTGLAGALAALATGQTAAREIEARRRDSAHAAQGAEGEGDVHDEKKPCGPTAKENRCAKHKDCCTKYCKKPKTGGKSGRCRCIKPGKKCKNGQTCCGGATCTNKKCTRQPTCGATGGACAADANCCSGLVCLSGACGVCTPTVCASGCAFSDVNTAYAAAQPGDTIYLDTGVYPTGITVDKDITLTACPGVTGVVLHPDRVLKDLSDTYYVAIRNDNGQDTFTITLRNLTVAGTTDGVTNSDESLLNSIQGATVNWVIEDSQFSDAYVVLKSVGGQITVSGTTFTRNSYPFNFNSFDSYSTVGLNVSIVDSTFVENLGGYLIDAGMGDATQDRAEFHLDVQRTVFDYSNDSTYIYADALSYVAPEKTTLSFTDCEFKNGSSDAFSVYG